MIRTCQQCGQRNRVTADHLADTGRCGACKASLPPLHEPVDADAALFDEIVAGARVPVLVDFWAPWCQPCLMAAPEVKKAAATLAGKAVVLKVNTEQHPAVAARYGIRGIPNFVILYNRRVVHQQAGLTNHRDLERLVTLAQPSR